MDRQYAREYEQFELTHWWHVPRRRLITDLLDRYAHASPDPTWLDVGCGTGVLLNAYTRIPNDRKMGLEVNEESVARAREKGLDVRHVEREWDLKSYGTFDVITLCDVIEHVEHDAIALDAAYAALKPGGTMLVTVPALMSLWSDHDVVNQHFRRYTMKTLARLFDDRSRWDVLYRSYFSSLLLPMIWTVRKLKNLKQRFKHAPPAHDLAYGPALVDRTLLAVFQTEVRMLRRVRMPLGSSLVLVARKRADAATVTPEARAA